MEQLKEISNHEVSDPKTQLLLTEKYNALSEVLRGSYSFAYNLLVYGIRKQIDTRITDPELREQYIDQYAAALKRQDANWFRAHLRKLFLVEGKSSGLSLIENSEIFLFNNATFEAMRSLQILQARMNELGNVKNQPVVDRATDRSQEEREQIDEEIKKLKKYLANLDTLKVKKSHTRFYIKVQDVKSLIPLPTAEELREANFISSMPFVYKLQEQAGQLDWNYTIPKRTEKDDSVSAFFEMFVPAM